MKTRIAAGILAGLVALWLVFYCLLFTLGAVWPAFREVGAQVMENNDYSGLTTGMLLLLLPSWCIAYFAAGWLTVRISGKIVHAMIAVTPFFIFAAYNHFYAMWVHFPPWYNFGVVLLVYPLAYLGGMLVKSGRSTAGENKSGQ